eukprot:4641240-Pyramimonas_sp.AAC.1
MPEGACRNPACRSCSGVSSKRNAQWLCTECYPMDEHNCTYLLIQPIQDQARLAEANTQREFLSNQAHLAERARLDREELTETVIEARKTFEAERIALAMAARE